MATPDETKLELFLQWLQLNRAELRGCKIKYSDTNKCFGIFSSADVTDGILLVVPLDLAITPMRVLQDPTLGPECKAMFEEGEVDDRFLMILFLTVERLRNNSSWKPYLDMLPTSFGNPLWFTDDELLELKGTTLYKATKMQKQNLQSLYDDKVKNLVKRLSIVDENLGCETCFEDFLWANSIFWTRALNIPMPRSYVFPQIQGEQDCNFSNNHGSDNHNSNSKLVDGGVGERHEPNGVESQVDGVAATLLQGENVWVEGLVPGIDFCNHDFRAVATWEVDGTGSTSGVLCSMYLISAEETPFPIEKEITISYGNKGNEELLYLYGFVIDNNPDDFLMVHYPVEATQNIPFAEAKLQLLEAQKAEMRCLLPRSLLDHGFFALHTPQKESNNKCTGSWSSTYSWSGQRRMPSYFNKLVFPESFLTVLRTIAMKEDELFKVSSLLEELVGSEGERQPSDAEVQAAIWEACGDSGAFQLLVDLLNTKMMDLEEGSGTEDHDTELLQKAHSMEILHDDTSCSSVDNGNVEHQPLSRNKWSSIVYRRGQKQLTRLFLKEAEQALQLAMSEGN